MTSSRLGAGSIESWHLRYLQAVEEDIDLAPEDFAARIPDKRLRRAVLERLRTWERTYSSLVAVRVPKPRELPRIPGYRIYRESGRGGAGAIYHAAPLEPGPDFAVKVLHLPGTTPRQVKRFRAECAYLEAIEHQNVARFRTKGRLPGALYLVMEWIDGPSLVSILESLKGFEPVRVATLRFDRMVERLRLAARPGGRPRRAPPP